MNSLNLLLNTVTTEINEILTEVWLMEIKNGSFPVFDKWKGL